MSCLKNKIIILIFLLIGLSSGQFPTFPKFPKYISQGVAFEAETQALLARMTTPTAARQILINNYIKTLKDGGVWSLGVVLIPCAADVQANGLINWIENDHHLTNQGTTFTTDRGFQGNGSSQYLDLDFIPSTDGNSIFVQNSGSFLVYDRTNGTFTSGQMLAGRSNAPVAYISLSSSNDVIGRLNSAAAGGYLDILPGGWFTGLVGMNRSNATSIRSIMNGRMANIDTIALASTGLNAGALDILKDGNAASGYCNHQVAMIWIGGSLTSAQHLTLYSATETYLDALGAGVAPGDSLVHQNAEGAGYDNTEIWTESGTVVEDSTSRPLRGSQSIYIANNTSYTGHYFSISSDTVGCHYMFRANDVTPAGDLTVFQLRTGTTAVASVQVNTAGRLRILCGGTQAGTVILSDNTTYHVWFRYILGTGSNAKLDIWYNTTATLPGTPEATMTTGTGTRRVDNVRVTGFPSGSFYDQIIITKNSIGSVAP